MKPKINPFILNSQRLSLLTGILAVVFSIASSNAVELLKYQMGQVGPQIQDPVNGAAGGNLIAASGLASFNVFSTQTLNGSALSTLSLAPINGTADFAAAMTNQSWFTFTLTVGPGVTDLDLTTLSFNSGKGGASVRGFGLLVTTPTTTDETVQGSTTFDSVRPTNIVQTISLASVASLQNLTPGQVVTFKIPIFTPAASSTVILDDITVSGEGGAVVVVDPPGTRTKKNNTDDLNLLSSWATGTVPPTPTEVTQWNDVVLGANSTLLGADVSWQGIRILNPGGPVTIGGANTLTHGTSGIAMDAATQDLTINSNLTIGTGNLSWNVAALRTLTLSTGTFTRPSGTTLTMPGLGTVASSMANLASNTAGIVGTWATTGTGATTQYATFTGIGSNIGALAGTPAADGSALIDTTGTDNYDLATFGGAVPAEVSANTIRYTGAAGATSTGATSFAVNGLMNAGSGTWTIDTHPLTVGTNQELVVNTAVSGIAIASVIDDNSGGASALTKVGPGVLTLSGLNNSYTGPTTINSGLLDVGAMANNSLGVAGLYFNGTDAVLQGNGSFTRNFSGVATATDGQITGFTGGFAAKDAPLTVNFGGFTDTISLSGVSPKFGRNFIFGSASSNDKVTVENPINLNGAVRVVTANPGLAGTSAEFSGILSGATPSGINKLGTGLLTLSNSNTYGGNTLVGAGILQISNGNALGAAALGGTNTTTVSTGASLQLIDGIATDPNETLTISGTGATNVGALQAGVSGGTWAGPITLGNAAARIGAIADSTLEVTGTISGGVGIGLAISGGAGTGVVVLKPDTVNTYPGQTTIVRGILRLGKENALPITTVMDAKDPVNSTDAAVFDLAGFNQTLAGLFDSGTLTAALPVITNSDAANASILKISGIGNYTFDGAIEASAGTISVVKEGTGTQVLNGNNTYTGTTDVNVGVLSIRNSAALGVATSTGDTKVVVTGTTVGSVSPALAAGGRLVLGNNIACPEPIILEGMSEQPGGYNASIESVSDNNSLDGDITLVGSGGQRITVTAGSLNVNGTITRQGTDVGILVLRTGNATATMDVNNTIDLNGAGINIQGLGTVTLNAAASEVVSATVAFGGPQLTFRLGLTNALPETADLSLGTANTAVGSDQGNFDLAGNNQTVRALTAFRSTGASPSAAEFRMITNSSEVPSVLTAGNTTVEAETSNFDGVIEDGAAAGGVSLTKVGAGALVLTGINTYTGPTMVSQGTLALVGGSQASPITVSSGAFLGFTLGSPTTSSAAVSLGAGAVKVTGEPSLPSYTLMTAASITGTPVLDPEIAGYALQVINNNELQLNTVAGGNTYADWLIANAPATGFGTDSDNDGVSNGVENVLGSNPNAFSPGLTEVSASAGSATFTHELNPTIASDVDYDYEWSTDLVEWKTSGESNAANTMANILPSVPVSGVVTVTTTITSGPATTLFVRLVAIQP